MEKISRILPPSRRVATVDVEQSQPVRPGAPEFGRPTQRLEIQDRVSLSSGANIALQERAPTTYRNPKESARARVVEDIAEKFFNPNAVAKEDGEGVQSEEILKRLNAKAELTQSVD
ncbi:MAG: hypothetical protein IPM97_09980 [Bdellovibrionaceae bacterium]|nr:hypothetical protein [Pseudobdellovibrionaceae bacterium]